MSPLVQAVFPAPLPEAHRYYFSGRYGYTAYDVTGYYTGREIDTYEWHILQYGVPAGTPDEEQRHAWPDKYPEFCIESYCVTPDFTGKRRGFMTSTPQDEADFRRAYKKETDRMRADGVPFCSKPAGSGQ